MNGDASKSGGGSALQECPNCVVSLFAASGRDEEIAELVVIWWDEGIGIQGGVRGDEPAGDQGSGSLVPLVEALRVGDLKRECGGGLYWVGFGRDPLECSGDAIEVVVVCAG